MKQSSFALIENIKTEDNLIKLISEESKGNIAYGEIELETPIYYNNKMNVLDDFKSYELGTWKKVKNYTLGLYSKKDSCSSLFFISHKEDEIKGKPQLIEEYQKDIILVTKTKKVKKDETIITYRFFDDDYDKRDRGIQQDYYANSFFIYRISYNNKEHILLSERKLTPDLYRFRGMKIILKDNSEISKFLKLDSLTNIFIIAEEEKAIKCLDKENLIKHMQELKEKYELNKEAFIDYLFTNNNKKIYSHTEDYTKLTISFLFSGKYEDYPLHLIVFAPAGTGKTTELECINNKFEEEKSIFEAGSSTLKGLIPSFREKPANIGYILQCVRIGLIDELFKMIEKSESGRDLSYLMNYLNQLNMLLEHKDRTIGSGVDTIRAKSTAKLLFMTNPYRNKKTIYDHVGLIDITTLSRTIPIVHDLEERKLINKKEIIINQNKRMANEEFLTIYDSCQDFLIEYEEEIVKDIYKKTLNTIKGSMNDVWKARGLHHSILLLDGLVKFRCLFENDSSFKANAQDYGELEKMLIYIIKSWDCGLRNWESEDGL